MSKPHIQKHSDKIYEMHITLSFKKRFFFIKYSYKETECHKYDTLIYSIFKKTIIANLKKQLLQMKFHQTTNWAMHYLAKHQTFCIDCFIKLYCKSIGNTTNKVNRKIRTTIRNYIKTKKITE